MTALADPHTTRSSLLRAGAVGLFAGAMSGLFGVGGGIVLVPLLMLVVRLDPRIAAATSLAAVLPISVFGLFGYALAGQVDWLLGLVIIGGALVGTTIGTRLLTRLPEKALLYGFSALLVLVGARMFFADPTSLARAPLDLGLVLEGIALGLFSGILAGLFGVGGGFVIVPAMVLLFGEPSALAKGTSLLVIVPTAVLGTWVNHRKELVNHRVALVTGLVGAGSAFGLSQVSVGLDERVANLSFGALLLFVAIRMAWAARQH